MHLKRLDIFVLKTFGILFVGTFFICLFIFIMQFLWLYVNDIVAKGLGLAVLAKFFYYAALTLVPKALPLAVLLASLITFGNFGERVELTAMKSAGISLVRVMRPLAIFCGVLCVVSFYFQNVTIPHSQLKLQTLLYSMKQKSPELEIPEGSFYDGISGYNLYVRSKDRDTGLLRNVVIYDLTDGAENAHIIKADSGRMLSTADKRYLQFTLYHGEQFENLNNDQISRRNIPYRREVFDEKNLLIEFDGEFKMEDGSWLSSNASNKNMTQLVHDMDSLVQEQDSLGRVYYQSLKAGGLYTIPLNHADSTHLAKAIEEDGLRSINLDSVYRAATRDNQMKWRQTQRSKVENLKSDTSIKSSTVYRADKNIRKHRIEWWNKITLSLSCLVFFFIGAPLGAIIRKGGLGMPVVVSVFFFIIYYILDTSGAKLAREGEISIWFGRWLSTLVLAPLGAFFTWKANRDSGIFNADAYRNAFRWLLTLRSERHLFCKEVIIDDPDYVTSATSLKLLSGAATRWAQQHEGVPSYYRFLVQDAPADEPLHDVLVRMEEQVETLANSRDVNVLDRAGHFPVFSVSDHLVPFADGRLRWLCFVLFPVGLLFWLRGLFFRRRRRADMAKIAATCQELIEVMRSRSLLPPEPQGDAAASCPDDFSD